jgi:hypothetical protein
MARAETTELIDSLKRFYQLHYEDDIQTLCEEYPDERRSLYIDWETLNTYDAELADDFLSAPDQLREYAEEALRLYDIPSDVSLGQAHIRLTNPPQSFSISALASHHAGQLVTIKGYVQACSHVQPKIQDAAFECQRCGSVTRIPQTGSDMQTPHKCHGCERSGPFRINHDQSEFVDWQTGTLAELTSPTADRPQSIAVHLADDLAGAFTASAVTQVTGVPHLDDHDPTEHTFGLYVDAYSVRQLDDPDWEQWATDYLGMTIETPTVAQTDLEAFVQRSRQIITTADHLDESNTQAKILTPFIHVLGWNVFAPEVQFEYSGDDETVGGNADYALLDRDGHPAVIIEAKRVSRSLDPHLGQLKEYMRVFGANWGVLSNGDRYLMLRATENSPSPDERQILNCRLEELLQHRKKLTAISKKQYQ